MKDSTKIVLNGLISVGLFIIFFKNPKENIILCSMGWGAAIYFNFKAVPGLIQEFRENPTSKIQHPPLKIQAERPK